MKIIQTGDWHCTKGLQTDIVLQFLEFLEDYYWDNDIGEIHFNGDLFDKSSNIKNEAFIPVFMKLMEMSRKGIQFRFIVGNHDIMNIDNDSIVETLSAFAPVYKKGTWVEIEGHNFYFLPYTKREEDIPASGDYLITHQSIADFAFDNAYNATEKQAFSRSLFEGWGQVFTGHFHKHQNWGNICYVGSINQLHRGESGVEKGFVVLDTDTESWEFVPYTSAPQYVVITEADISQLKNRTFENCIVVVRIGSKIKDYAKLRYVLFEKGAVDIIPIFESKNEETKEIEEVSISSNIPAITRDIIKEKKPEHLKEEKLLEVFDSLKE